MTLVKTGCLCDQQAGKPSTPQLQDFCFSEFGCFFWKDLEKEQSEHFPPYL